MTTTSRGELLWGVARRHFLSTEREQKGGHSIEFDSLCSQSTLGLCLHNQCNKDEVVMAESLM